MTTERVGVLATHESTRTGAKEKKAVLLFKNLFKVTRNEKITIIVFICIRFNILFR